MANELIRSEEGGLVAAIGGQGIGELLKPLTRKIHLFDTYVAGTSYLEDRTVLDELKEGDGLVLLREENKFDDNAILILTESRQKIGYVPEKDNRIFARLMDAGKLLTAEVAAVGQKGSLSRIRIGIYLVDF